MYILESISEIIKRIIGVFLIFCMAIMIAVVVWQVITRFLTSSPSTFTDELSRYLLIWIGILGGAYTYALKKHLALEVLMPKLSFVKQHILAIIINTMISVFSCIAFIYGGYIFVIRTLAHHQVSPSLVLFGNHVAIGYVYIVLPLSGILIFYFNIVEILKSLITLCTYKQENKVIS